ncbi:unnamed protein product [Brassicogethes aeneus]|uniref:DUF4806 domain-containing protein n=1 Tax=Brassicogethes aeneus TaxID=1431903 RepID=A0A9P0ASV0_BRAAE|nr:unnamed protein product [Brassicogethes aeneus]
MFERVLEDLQILKSDVKNLLKLANLEKITNIENIGEQLSFSTYDELINFNEKLVDVKYFSKTQYTLSLLGGRDLNDTTKRILSIIINHQLALKINWIGANEKGSIRKLVNLLKLIYGAIRKNAVCCNATNTEINMAIKTWVKNAPDRAGGRSGRRKLNLKGYCA